MIKEEMTDKYREFLESDDVLFHYTNTLAAIKILCGRKFRFSTFANSNDPFEYTDKGITPNGWERKIKDKCVKVSDEINELIKSELYFISFCENYFKDRKLEVSGFKKARMWAQYGENHRGMCLVFSKNELKELLEELNDLEILSFERVIYNKNLDGEYKYNLTVEDSGEYDAKKEAWDYVESNIEGLIRQKPIDYRDENEYRIVVKTLDERNNYEIDISKILKGVILGDKFPYEDLEVMKNLCKNLGIFCHSLCWFDGEFWLSEEP